MEVPPPITPPSEPQAKPPRPPRKIWAVLAHAAYLIPLHIPGIIVTLIIWAWKRKSDPFIDDQCRESLNFQLTYLALNTALSLSCFGLGCAFTPVVWIAGAVLCIVAAVKAADGEKYRYPWIFRLIA
jgi:uncharacterized Tic20 family protein